MVKHLHRLAHVVGVMRRRLMLANVVNRLLPTVLFGVVFVLLGYAVYQRRDELLSYEWHLNYSYLALASLTHSVALGFTAVIWHLMLGRLAGFWDLRKNLRIYYLTAVAKRIPGTVWFVAGRAYMYEQEGVPKTLTLTAVVLETTLVYLAGVLMYLLLLLLSPGIWLADYAVWMGVIVGPMALVAAQPKVLELGINFLRVRSGRQPISMTVCQADTLQWLCLYSMAWIFGGVALYALINVVYPLPTTYLVPTVTIATASGVVGLITLLLPGVVAVKEVVLIVLLTGYLPLPIAVVVALLYRGWLTLDEVLWAALTARWRAPG